jgi:hypothetical protein
MEQLHRDGFCKEMDTQALALAYQQAGIALRGPGHMNCNGVCSHGPHVVLGGKCMCPPTPGTVYFEQVVVGRAPAAPAPAAKH